MCILMMGIIFKIKREKNIHNEITEDMMCKAKVYSNPLEMLNNEFDENYTGKQIKEFENEKVVFISNTPRGMGLWDADNIYNYPSVITETGDYGVLTTRNDDIISLPKGVRFCPNCGNNIEYLLVRHSIYLILIKLFLICLALNK